MTDLTRQYLAAARTAAGLLAHRAVADHWTEPSALDGFTVGGLAAHLAAQITSGAAAVDADPAGKPLIGLFERYDQAGWLAADIDNEDNTAIRTAGEETGAAGPDAVIAAAATALGRLDQALPGLPGDAPSGDPRWPYATTLDDFLVTRLMELVVHADDLAYSVGVDTPEFDQDAFDTATWVLARLAARRHGRPALIRALARSERAPGSISAL
ncbi:maleylpyruvate isomerase N-terminal domain-containing protein [Glycomyces sp. NPDC047010]|uniref:maleylpyruvate isomerase N-terminal domain-containing protein n=1 Tax=Glycomyces sp. NPDC047010 TaxID=3155023 RepID=UPI0033E8E400